MKIRLVMWEDCERECPGCCMRDWDFFSLPPVTPIDLGAADQILLTGGEPLLDPYALHMLISYITKYSLAEVIVYTAKTDDTPLLLGLLGAVDGLTVTLHDQSDVTSFLRFNAALPAGTLHRKSLRLNVFKGVDITGHSLYHWNVRDNMVWIKDCPLPEGEVLMRFDPSLIK